MQTSERAPWKITLVYGGGKRKGSEERYPASFFNVVCWPQCEGNASAVKSGDFVEVTGKLRQRKFRDSEGKDRSTVEIIADSILLKSSEQEQPKPITPTGYGRLGITDADIPF